jgi:tRNA (mo5U34)-methyltransferase
MAQIGKNVPNMPPGFDKDRLFAGIHWFQRWQLFAGVYVPGSHDIESLCECLQLPEDLSGKRVLDVGAWNGCLSFECERRGAREVVALGPEDPAWTGFNRLRQAIRSERTHHVLGSIYNLNPRAIGLFDIVLCCGIIYHLRYPLLGIDNLRRVCNGELFLETHVCDEQLLVEEQGRQRWARLEEAAPSLAGTSVWQFYRFDELFGDTSNWFNPNTTAVIEALESAGFQTQLLERGQRATFRATVKEGIPEFLTLECAESVYYDVISRPLFTLNKPTVPCPPRWTVASRRQIEQFHATGEGREPAEIMALRKPVEPWMPVPPRVRGSGAVAGFAKKMVRRLLRRAG